MKRTTPRPVLTERLTGTETDEETYLGQTSKNGLNKDATLSEFSKKTFNYGIVILPNAK